MAPKSSSLHTISKWPSFFIEIATASVNRSIYHLLKTLSYSCRGAFIFKRMKNEFKIILLCLQHVSYPFYNHKTLNSNPNKAYSKNITGTPSLGLLKWLFYVPTELVLSITRLLYCTYCLKRLMSYMDGPLILIIKENTDSEISCTYLQKKIPREPEKLSPFCL